MRKWLGPEVNSIKVPAERLKDPEYLDRHLAAAAVMRHISGFSSYNSVFLRHYEAAKRYLDIVRPDALERFVAGFAPLRPRPDFAPAEIAELRPPHGKARRKQMADTMIRDPSFEGLRRLDSQRANVVANVETATEHGSQHLVDGFL